MQLRYEYALNADEIHSLSAARLPPTYRRLHGIVAVLSVFSAGVAFGSDFILNGFIMLALAAMQWCSASGSMVRLVSWIFPHLTAPWQYVVEFLDGEIRVRASNVKLPASHMEVSIPWDRVRATGSVAEYHDCFAVEYPTRNGRTPIRSLHFPKRVLGGAPEIQELRQVLADGFHGPVNDLSVTETGSARYLLDIQRAI